MSKQRFTKLAPLKDNKSMSIHDMRSQPIKCDHYFIHKTANLVMCNKCNVGYMLRSEWTLKDNKIYYKGKLVA